MYNNLDELVIVLNAVEFYTVVDTSQSPVHNTPCPLHLVRDKGQDQETVNGRAFQSNTQFPVTGGQLRCNCNMRGEFAK